MDVGEDRAILGDPFFKVATGLKSSFDFGDP
jgi:hypothetical protein